MRDRYGQCRDGKMLRMDHPCLLHSRPVRSLGATRSSLQPALAGYRYLTCSMALLVSGCIAPNLPSHRYHDPHDRGGLFGDYRSKSAAAHGELAPADSGSDCATGTHHGCSFVEDGLEDEHVTEKPPEIPWPRYHPVPTRPVFSPPVISPQAGPEFVGPVTH